MRKSAVPFSFVLELLDGLGPYTRPMFGCTAVYVGEKIVLILREKPSEPQSNGVWIATTRDHHSALKKDFPSMCSISVLGPGEAGWQMIRASDPDFEERVEKLCELVHRGDPRIGKIPDRKKRSKTKAKSRVRRVASR